MSQETRKSETSTTAPPSRPGERTEFGSLADMCLSHNPDGTRELFGEFSTLYPDNTVPPDDALDTMNLLSLTKKR
jgi:hypothetical protein